MSGASRVCSKCGSRRLEKFFATPRARVCSKCKRTRTQLASRATHLEETYGITEAEYMALLEAQDGRCAICGGKRSYNLDVDHDHAKERLGLPMRETVRGLLCRQCNRRILRSCKDSVATLEAAIRYLNAPPAFEVLGTHPNPIMD